MSIPILVLRSKMLRIERTTRWRRHKPLLAEKRRDKTRKLKTRSVVKLRRRLLLLLRTRVLALMEKVKACLVKTLKVNLRVDPAPNLVA
jgi:hypothetical protein